MKIRLSKKFVLILGGGLVLCGASGAAAVLVGTDKILGPSYRDVNGLTCTTLNSVKLNKDGTIWIRKYVTSDEGGDGISRVRTALRVARAVQEKEKADLVQVAMIDPSGPKDRADMRGRMIAAQVVYIPDPAKLPDGAADASYSAYYLDGAPTDRGEYFGMRIDLPLEDVEHLEARLTDKADCIDPLGSAAASEHGGAAKDGKGKASGGHGEAKPSAHGEAPAGHGETSADHGEAAAGEAHEYAPSGEHGDDAAAEESGGLLSSLTGMIFGTEEEPSAAGHEQPASPETAAHEATAVDGHDASASAAGTGDDHGDQAAHQPAAGTAASPAAGQPPVKPDEHAEQPGILGQVKGMIFGGSPEEAGAGAHKEASADAVHEARQAGEQAHQPEPKSLPEKPQEPRTSAEGGKRWSDASEEDEIRAEDHAVSPAHDTEKHAEAADGAEGANEADAAGAAWLEKFRAQSAAPQPDTAKH
jgi:hypothetical protein